MRIAVAAGMACATVAFAVPAHADVASLVIRAAVMAAPTGNADQATPGQQCYNWHATATDSDGRTLVCTHTPDTGHLMFWEYGVEDS